MRSLLLLLAVFTTAIAHGGIEIYSERLEGSAVVTSASLSVVDDKYFEMVSDPSGWSSDFVNHKVTNTVLVGLNPDVIQQTTFNGTVGLEIKYYVWDGVNLVFDEVIENKTLQVEYNTNGTAVITDQSSFIFEDAHRVIVTITGLTGVVAENIFVESRIEVERYYLNPCMPCQISNIGATPYPPSAATYPFSEISNEFIDLSWDFWAGAESYELEYVHINDYTLTSGQYISPSYLPFDYYLNSTRVELSDNYYRVPNIYDHGYFIFRVRPIYRTGPDYTNKTPGAWSAPESGFIGPHHPSGQVLRIWREYNPRMNWGHQVAFTEEGKRFESVSYADGLGRGRQSVSRNTATDQTVVSNIYYDEIGRVVIADLPTPLDISYPTHHPNFNRADVSGYPSFNNTNFDNPNTSDGTCAFDPNGMADQYGTSRYYSIQNPDQDGANANIPNAGKLPYSRVHYLNDFTGRVDKTAAAGPTLTLGAGHETEYIYVTATQAELFQLFGEEVGDASHYQKMVTVDPNGQVYVQYSDMAGRVVASYMMGPSPENLDALDETVSEVITTPIMVNGSGQIPDVVVPSATLTFVQYFAEDLETYTMDYSFTKQQYESVCLEEGVCFDCVYDLELKIQEKCGTILHESTITLSGEELDALCNEEPGYEKTFTLAVPKGEYTFTKTLSVNQEAINEYWCMYIDNITEECLPPMNTVFDGLYNEETFPECDDEEYLTPFDEAENCDLTKLLMASDITPGGQYARYTVTNGVYSCTDPTSIFYGGTPLYTTFDYGTITVLDPVTSTLVSPGELSLKNFILLFDDSWATYLIANDSKAHPESCMLGFCEANAGSYAYDQGMFDTYSFDDAISYNATTDMGGYFLPLTFSTAPSSNYVSVFFGVGFSQCDNNNDPFFDTGGMGAAYAAAMEDDMLEYVELGQSGATCAFSIWEYAILSAYVEMNPGVDISTMSCTDLKNMVRSTKDDCSKDLVWAYYRTYYQELKQKYFQLAQEDYAANNCPSMPEIGTGSGAYADKWPRFPSIAFMNEALNNVISGDPVNYGGGAIDFSDVSSATDVENLVEGITAQGCNMACEEYSHEWMLRLADCNIDPADTAAMRASFKALCMNGCDQEHPGGASTPNYNNPYYDATVGMGNPTINDILASFGYSESMLCTELLIDQPLPYESTLAMIDFGMAPLDQCACDQILAAKDSLAGSGFTYVEELFEEMTGVYMDDIDYLICECENAGPGTGGWHPGYTWPGSANATLAETEIEVSPTLGCPESWGKACVDCETVTPVVDELLDRFGFDQYATTAENYAAFSAVTTSYMVLTNFLNAKLSFQMEYDDYADFIGGCLATTEAPYCTVNPLFEEVSAVLKLVSFRGQLTASSTIDLVQENIVFANSQLMEDGFGRYFSTDLVGDDLTLTFSNGGSGSCTIELSLPDTPSFGYEDIVSFGAVYPTTSECSGNSDFQVEVHYFSCGQLQTGVIDGWTDCMDVNLCVCGDEGQTLCNDPYSTDPDECYQPRLDELYDATLDEYQQLIAEQYMLFKGEYNTTCAAAFDTENYAYTGPVRMYQYTLFYYDQAGNLVQTVAPEGVDKLIGEDQNIIDAQDAVSGPGDNSVASIVPAHDYITSYEYNSYNQLTRTTNPDQKGDTRFWYDRFGRIVASQNPVQAAEDIYSYTYYDNLGRPLMVGQTEQSSPLTEAIVKADDGGYAFNTWVGAGTETEITLTIYDQTLGPPIEALFANGKQENLRLRVASVLYYPVAAPLDQYESAIHYSYDIHGNVKEQIQDVPSMAPVAQDKKSTQYNFELISGNVKKVLYQEGEADQLIHEYHYDELNRLTEVETSVDDVHYARDAHYHYYDYGPLARVEYGQHQVQGQDFAYTINGWLKGMNASELNPERDMGRDGLFGCLADNTAANGLFAKDVTAYTLGYFQEDYKPIGENDVEIAFGVSGFNQQARNLYNGNIRSLVSTIYEMETVGKAFRYDQLNRLKEMRAFYYNDANAYTWDGIVETPELYNAYTYDKNGNINTLQRNGLMMNGLYMDHFAYHYVGLDGAANASSSFRSNRLDYVVDSGADDADPNNIGDIKAGMTSGNYAYDDLGQLTRDEQEGITSIEWRYGDKKISRITKTGEVIEFRYNPFGQRILKTVTAGTEPPRSTFYSYDANGQVMAVYDLPEPDNVVLQEQHLYGASRIGMVVPNRLLFNGTAVPNPYEGTEVFNNELGQKFYELSNYLGNVEAVITDRKTPGSYTLSPTIVDQVGISVGVDGTITRTVPGTGWNVSGGATIETVENGDYVEWIFGNNNVNESRNIALGLSYVNTNSSYASIKYAWYTGANASTIFIDGVAQPSYWYYSLSLGDALKIAREDGMIRWYQNGELQFETTDPTPCTPMIVDFAMYYENTSIFDLKIQNSNPFEAVVVKTADYYPFGMEIRTGLKDGAVPNGTTELIEEEPVQFTDQGIFVNADGDLEIDEMASADAWRHGANGVQGIENGEYIEFEIANTTFVDNYYMVGLSYEEGGYHYNTIDFAWYIYTTGEDRVYENGSNVYSSGSYSVGDKYRILRDNGFIRYYKNGVLKRSVTDTDTGASMVIDVSLFRTSSTAGCKVYNLVAGKWIGSQLVEQQVVYTNLSGVQEESTGSLVLYQNNSISWSYGASGVQSVLAGEYVQFEAPDGPLGENRGMVGLSSTNQNHHYNTIEYAWYLFIDGTCRIYESGSQVASTPYVAGDVFRIIREGGNIVYYKNNTAVRTVTDPSVSNPMVIDITMLPDATYPRRLHNITVGKLKTVVTYDESAYIPYINSDEYRYAYNGMEKDNEVKGNGNSYTTEFRQYDPRLGRWLSLDPLAAAYPMMSPYVAFNNNPVFYIDPLGLEGTNPEGEPEKKTYDQKVDKVDAPGKGVGKWKAKINRFKMKYSLGKYKGEEYDAYRAEHFGKKEDLESARDDLKNGKIDQSTFLNSYRTNGWKYADVYTKYGYGSNASYDGDKAKEDWGDPISYIKTVLPVAVGMGLTGGLGAAYFTTGGAATTYTTLSPYLVQAANFTGRYALTGGRYTLQGVRWAGQQAWKYKVPHKLGVSYGIQFGQTGSLNPMDHNMVGYGLSIFSPLSIESQCYIGATGGLVNYTPNRGLYGAWNRPLGVTAVDVFIGGTAPLYNLGGSGIGFFLGGTHQIIGGRAVNHLEETSPE